MTRAAAQPLSFRDGPSADRKDFLPRAGRVTSFGGGVDRPARKRGFPRLRFDQLHVALCPTLRRLDLRGGLKDGEHALGIERSKATTGLSGWDAVRLWREWRYGRED